MEESQAYSDRPYDAGSLTGIAGVGAVQMKSSIENRLEILQRSINALGEDAHLLTDRVRLVRRLVPTAQTELNNKSEPEEYTSELARVLSDLTTQVNHISAFIKDATNELEL